MIVPLTSLALSALCGIMPPAPHASRIAPTVVRSDAADSLLTTDALTNMTAFWTAFMKEPASITGAGRKAHQKPLTVEYGGASPLQLPGVVDMMGLATAFPAVETDLKNAHLTSQQWEQYRLDLFATVVAIQASATPAASSAVAQNMTFLQAHQQEFSTLQATGMWFPQVPAAGQGGGAQPTTFAGIQAQDQAQTAQLNQFVASQGPLASPRDTAKTTIGSAHVTVDYGRPSMRGRAIFGSLVPYSQVWRTGANMATTLVTDKDLTIGTVTVPAGSYTLYTIPDASGWQLIINKENGQWGLSYYQQFDLGRTPMTVSTTKTSVEKFLIDFAKGKLRMQWDTTVAEVAVAEKK